MALLNVRYDLLVLECFYKTSANPQEDNVSNDLKIITILSENDIISFKLFT